MAGVDRLAVRVPGAALAMALVLVAGFSFQLAMGRSSFSAPIHVHLHALVFMGWLGLFSAQAWLGARGPAALHRSLGLLAALWLFPMLVMGILVTVRAVQQGRVPFFFRPQHFLFADILTLLAFIGLVLAALALRHRTDWHWRLHVAAMAALMGPGFGRLLPMPLMMPWAFEAAALLGLLVPAVLAIGEARRGAVHPAWAVGALGLLVALGLAQVLARSGPGDTLYRAVVAGTPGEAVPGMAFPPPPGPAIPG